MRLSQLAPLDLQTLRDVSLERARKAFLRGTRRPLHIAIYSTRGRAVLEDGRHRVLVAMRQGELQYPAIVRTYGPRGGIKKEERIELHLDALP